VDPGATNPTGECLSSRCTTSYLITARNHGYRCLLILHEVGEGINQSLSSAIKPIGFSQDTTDLDRWMAEPLVAFLVEDVLKALLGREPGPPELACLRHALRESWEADQRNRDKRYCWATIERLYGATAGPAGTLSLLSALGLPACSPGELGMDNHLAVLDGVASLLEASGLAQGFEELLANAAGEAELVEALGGFREHLRSVGILAADEFARTPLRCCVPQPGEDGIAPSWWQRLTVGAWSGLLASNEASEGRLELRVEGALTPAVKGMPTLVAGPVGLVVSLGEGAQGGQVSVSRASGNGAYQPLAALELPPGGTASLQDPDPPRHDRFLRYRAEMDGYSPATSKVIALGAYSPGIAPVARNARSINPPRLNRRARSATGTIIERWEGDFVLVGTGQHTIELFAGPTVRPSDVATCHNSSTDHPEPMERPINQSDPIRWNCLIETGEESHFDFSARDLQTGEERLFRVHVTAEEGDPTEVNSHFQRLVLENRSVASGDRLQAKVEPVRCRASDLEEFALESPNSYRPIILGPDFLGAWRAPDWTGCPTLSHFGLPVDPRPPLAQMVPPGEFLEARTQLLARLHPNGGNGAPEPAGTWPLSSLMRQGEFRGLVKRLLDAYLGWLKDDYDSAIWSDVVAVHARQPAVNVLESTPYAVLLSPLHPIRIAWQCNAQEILQEALDGNRRCPAASMANPAFFPDSLSLPCRTGAGSTIRKQYAAMASSSDYWGVLWSVDALALLGRGALGDQVFGRELGISVDGLSAGFTAAQVSRSLDEVARLLPGRTTLRANLRTDTTGHTSLNKGIEEWCHARLGPDNDPWAGSGELSLVITDQRSAPLQPEQAVLASLAARTNAAVTWREASPSSVVANQDISIIAHLGTINHEFSRQGLESAIDRSALARWRVRKQVAGEGAMFIAESRVAAKPPTLDPDSLGNALLSCVDHLESTCRHLFDSYFFAPNQELLAGAVEAASYSVVSSSSIDAACFMRAGRNSYLWDYELPSFARRAGENSGYFLLAKQSPSLVASTRTAILALGGDIPDEAIVELLDEVGRRGMPTLKRLTAGGATSLGEVGSLIALRMLQSEFRGVQAALGILPVSLGEQSLNLVVPADPFTRQFDDLRKGLGQGSAERPDLLVLSLSYRDGQAECLRVTPIEIKARTGQMPAGERCSSLGQAKAFGEFLRKLQAMAVDSQMWGFAFRGILANLLDYGFRVYGQLSRFTNTGDWATRHSACLRSLGGGELGISIDTRGRLLLIDSSPNSGPLDLDGDGFLESVGLSHADATTLLRQGDNPLLGGIRQTLGHWDLLPPDPWEDGPTMAAPPGEPSGPGSASLIPIPPGTPEWPAEPPGDGIAPAPEAGGESESTFGPGEPTIEISTPGVQMDAGNAPGPGDGWVHFEVGSTIHGFTSTPAVFQPGNTSLNHLNIGIVGDLGTGKTQLVQSLLYQLVRNPGENRGTRPNILIFDYKRDYSKPEFVGRTGARVVKPHQLPLNLFEPPVGALGGTGWLERAKFFCDVLEKLYTGIGPVQRVRIRESVKKAYKASLEAGRGSPTLSEVFETYSKENEVDSPYSIMSELVDGEYFVASSSQTMPFRDFISGITVIDLASVGQDDRTKNMLVVIFLNLFYEHMLQIEKKPFLGTSPQTRFIDTMILVDEADNIMKFEFDVLKKVLLQGREFGVGVLLASQYLSHFRTRHENYTEPLLTWFIHKVPNLSVRDLEGIGIAGATLDTVNKVKLLRPHECLYKTAGIDHAFIRGTPFYELAADRELQGS
jgi:hypothetical protein